MKFMNLILWENNVTMQQKYSTTRLKKNEKRKSNDMEGKIR